MVTRQERYGIITNSAEDNTTFEKVAAKLDSKAIPYEMFKENGEICSLIAKVCPKEKLQSIFKGLKLLK
ncbi:unnamed protein product [Cyprideis torosa]|uniref:Uncharacterized protein n=1 Tax=Cyprideis torosa TaxID=163714 RepID=A0A7R8W7A1_9CRUS|nr:unnamed protein product [Cyprideis torosa]CAG0882570.1 unnamed protein product [Cyprideis torosa]